MDGSIALSNALFEDQTISTDSNSSSPVNSIHAHRQLALLCIIHALLIEEMEEKEICQPKSINENYFRILFVSDPVPPLNQLPPDSVYQMGGSTHLMGKLGALRLLPLIFACALIVGVARPAAADGPATTLDGNHPDDAPDVVGAGAASPSQPLAMRVTMALRHRDHLARLLADQQDPASSQYHRWLTPDAFTSRFGPTDADLARVTRWLNKKGFTVKSAEASNSRGLFQPARWRRRKRFSA